MSASHTQTSQTSPSASVICAIIVENPSGCRPGGTPSTSPPPSDVTVVTDVADVAVVADVTVESSTVVASSEQPAPSTNDRTDRTDDDGSRERLSNEGTHVIYGRPPTGMMRNRWFQRHSTHASTT